MRSLTTSRAPSATVAMSLSIRSRLERRGELGARDSDTTCHEKKLKLILINWGGFILTCR